MDLTAIDAAAAQSLWAFVLLSFLIEFTPGPNMAYLAVVGVNQGRAAGFAAVAGVATGLALVGLAAAFGLASAINASPLLYQVLRWGGVIYLIWLGYDGWRDAAEPVGHAALGASLPTFFRRGLVTNLLNPKAAAFYIAVLPGFVDPGKPVLSQTLGLSATYVAVATFVHLAIVALASTAKPLLTDGDKSRVVRRALSASLVLVALWFAWNTRA